MPTAGTTPRSMRILSPIRRGQWGMPGRLIVNHDEIQGFMAAMEMSYAVTPPSLLNRLNAGDKIRFTLDAAKSAVTSIEVIDSAK